MRHPETDVSRRNFFSKIAGGSAAAFATLTDVKEAFAQSIQDVKPGDVSPGAWREDGGYWGKIRKKFMLEEGYAYMNCGTVGPTPRPVYDAMIEYWRLMAENPLENSSIFQHRIEAIRAKAASFVGASPDEIAITRNTSEGTTILNHGLDLKQGDEIIMTAYEHACVRETWRWQAKRYGLIVKEVTFPFPPTNEQVLNAFEAAMTPRTRVIHTTSPMGGHGCILPMKQLAALAHSKNALCFVDAAHSMGMLQFSFSDWGVDGGACNGHKWLCGPAGSGILYVKQDVQDRIWPNISLVRWDSPPKGARKYALSVGRRPWPAVVALEDAIDFQMAIGRARIQERDLALGSYLRQKVAEIPKITLNTANDPARGCGSTNLGIQGVPVEKLTGHLRQKYDVFVIPYGGGGCVRISTHFFNTFEQVDRVLQGLRDLSRGVA